MRQTIPPLLLLIVLAGCSTRGTSLSGWTAAQGGVTTHEAAITRAEAALARLWSATRRSQRPVRVHVLSSTNVAGYAWPSGDIYLTDGLVRLCDDDELCAAIAHEIGHLLADGHVAHPAGLRGMKGGLNQESQADVTGCRLLAAIEISPGTMSRMLAKVCVADPTCRESLQQRIQLLKQVYGATATVD